MTVTTFDSLAYSKKMKASGFTDQQAEGQAEALAEIIDGELATKTDLKILSYKIIIWLGSIIVIASGATISILNFLMNSGH